MSFIWWPLNLGGSGGGAAGETSADVFRRAAESSYVYVLRDVAASPSVILKAGEATAVTMARQADATEALVVRKQDDSPTGVRRV